MVSIARGARRRIGWAYRDNGSGARYSTRHERRHRPTRSSPRYHLFLILLILSVALPACAAGGPVPPSPTAQREQRKQARDESQDNDETRPDLSMYTDDEPTATSSELRQRAETTADLRWLPSSRASGRLLPGLPLDRPSILAEKQRSLAVADPARQARANAALASEAFTRASLVVGRWLDRRDPITGLLVTTRPKEGTSGWFYQDTSADLFPHIAIGARLLRPDRYSEMVEVLAAERRLAPPRPELPDDLLLPDGQRAGQPQLDRMFGAAEYVKDGLLPLIERLGPDPWLGRLLEVSDAILDSSAAPTRRGSIPANSNEVNGDVLQTLTRAYWATGDERYYAAADRIGRAYVEDMLPKTDWLPAHEWEFLAGEPGGRRRLRLSDHGNEIIAGLVGWHLVESLRADADAPAHRVAIRRMLDRMLANGRNPDGLWYRVIEIPSGDVDQEGLSDNWGYLFQAYLVQAAIERSVPGGEVERAERYEQASRDALKALPKYAYYPWQRGEMDGYADSIEGALYLLPRLPDQAAARWVDEQIGVLFGFQAPGGEVEDNYLDGNFVRTTLLYGLFLTEGVTLDPWRPDLLVGAAGDGACLEIALATVDGWDGRLRFDTPRHRDHLRLPIDYARLNEWPEGFAIDPGRTYELIEDATVTVRLDGSALAAGLPLRMEPGAVRSVQVCPID